MDVRLETLEAFDIITSFAIGPYPTSAPQAWEQLFTWLGKQNEVQPKQLIRPLVWMTRFARLNILFAMSLGHRLRAMPKIHLRIKFISC